MKAIFLTQEERLSLALKTHGPLTLPEALHLTLGSGSDEPLLVALLDGIAEELAALREMHDAGPLDTLLRSIEVRARVGAVLAHGVEP